MIFVVKCTLVFFAVLTTEELTKETERLRKENAALQTRIDEQVEAINDLDNKYNCSKSEPFVKRYNLLKDAIKDMQQFAKSEDKF